MDHEPAKVGSVHLLTVDAGIHDTKSDQNRQYSRIYADYKNVAEEVIERESVPPGYRSHVRRYFQLIRPRE